jgi:GntR family transcriptional regulator
MECVIMLLQIDHHSGVPIYRQVIDQVRHQIMAGQLREGDQLTTVRDLSVELKVNPMTVSKAYSLLEAEGLVERRRGIGLFVAGLPQDRKRRARAELLEWVVGRAVAAAVQFDVPEGQVQAMVSDLFRRSNSKKKGGTHE